MKKTIKSLLCAVALTGMGCSAMGQWVYPYENPKPWVDDTTSGVVRSFTTDESGWVLRHGDEIIRNPKENKVSHVRMWGSGMPCRYIDSWEYSDDRSLGWNYYELKEENLDGTSEVINKTIRTFDGNGNVQSETRWGKDYSTGTLLENSKYLYTYDENGKLQSESYWSRDYSTGTLVEKNKNLYTYDKNGKLQNHIYVNVGTGEQDTTKYEDGRLVYRSGYTKTERNDTTIFSYESPSYSSVERYYEKGRDVYTLRYTEYRWSNDSSYTVEQEYDTTFTSYNEAGLETRYENKRKDWSGYRHTLTENTYNKAGLLSAKMEKVWNSETEKLENRYYTTYEYDSKNQLIREKIYYFQDEGYVVKEYAYDHNGNLTVEFNSGGNYYWGGYTVYEYEGGKKKYAPFDPAMYPTDKYPANSPVAKHGKLQVSGKNMVDVNGNIVQLRGISTHGISWFPECYSESSVDALVDDWGINVLRIASYAENQVENEDWEWRRDFIDSMVNMCEKKGIYCIIDWHTLNNGTNDPWYVKDEAKAFFEYMSKKHAGKAHVMYEICNEPNYSGIANLSFNLDDKYKDHVSWARIKQYAQDIIDVIVKNDPNSIIIVGTPHWCQRVFAAANSMLDYPNTMYALHFYAASHGEGFREMGDSAIAKNCPIFVSEFGTCGSTGSGSIDVPETIKWFKWMNDNNLSWVNWNFADKAESSCLLKPNSCEEQNWDNYTESGRIIKWALADPELNGADSVLLVDAALKKNKYLRIKDIRFDYLGSCIAENPNFVTDNDIDGLVHCAYIKECLAEEPELAKDEARLDSCAKDKAADVALTNSSLHGVSVYPNPVKDNLVVDYDGGEFSVVLIDLLGSEVLREECVQGKNVVNVSSLAPGCYLVKVESNGKFHFEKMSKE